MSSHLPLASDKPFQVVARCHPGMIDAADAAQQFTILVAVLASKDEDPKGLADFEKALKVDRRVRVFGS